MKLISTLLVALLFSCYSLAQITIDPEIIVLESAGQEVELKFTISNNNSEFTEMYWMFEKGENFPSLWDIVICDDVICYDKNEFKSNANLPNNLEGGYNFELKITIKANGFPGSTYGILHMYDDKDCNNEVATSRPPITSVDNEFAEILAIYPNPTLDYFSIKNDDNIKSIEVLNICGQVLLRENHLANQSHSIAHLGFGVFYVVLRNEEDEILNTVILKKE